MFVRIGHFAVRRRWWVLVGSLAVVAITAVTGTRVFERLSGGGFDDPASESSRAAGLLEDVFGSGSPDLVLLVDAVDGDVDAPAVEAVSAELLASLETRPDVGTAVSYWSLGRVPPLRSADGDSALVLARLVGDEDAVDAATAEIIEEWGGRQGPVTVSAGGPAPVFAEVSETIESDLARAESVAVPLTLLLLVLVFGGLVAAGLPLVVGAIAVLGTFFSLWVVTQFTDVSIFSINLVTALGLGLAIDYSLFVVNRFREELAAGRSTEDAVVRTVTTAGRTVAVSALTVGISLSALLVFPLYFLRSFAWAGLGVTLVSMAAALLTLPALLAVLGPKVNSLRILGRRRAAAPTPGTGFWHRTAGWVMRRPLAVSAVVVGILVFLGLPFLRVEFGVPDQRVLPEDAPSRIATDRLATEFDSHEADAFGVVAPEAGSADAPVDAFAAQLSGLEGVARVDAVTGRYVGGARVAPTDATLADHRVGDAVRFTVVPDVVPISTEGEDLVGEIRALDAPVGEVLVAGASAELIDAKAAIADRLPIAALIIAGATFVLLFLMFGSVVVPLKAIVLNLLSLSATFGAMVWVFQDGNGAGLLDFTATGLTDTTTPILMFCIAFGLSMDYEVFLLSRIKEEHDAGADNETAVANGLARTGRIVTAAAALLSVTFIAFGTSGISFIKLFGVGLTLAVLMDATLVRATLVPAFMRLAGEANWWAPQWMRRLHERFGFSEAAPEAPLGPDDDGEGSGPSAEQVDPAGEPDPLHPALVPVGGE